MGLFSKKRESGVTNNDLFGVTYVIGQFKELNIKFEEYKTKPDTLTPEIALDLINNFSDLKTKFEKVIISIDNSQGITEKQKNTFLSMLDKPNKQLNLTYEKMLKYKIEIEEYTKISKIKENEK
jgi:hypothetical protein